MHPDGVQPHVLVMNDTQEIIDLLRSLLEDEGFRVSTSLYVLDLTKVKALAPDVIVQDLIFANQGDTGWKFLTMARLDRGLCRVPIVLCTAAVEVVRDEAMAAQLDSLAVEVVLKPFDLEMLLGAISKMLPTRLRAGSAERASDLRP